MRGLDKIHITGLTDGQIMSHTKFNFLLVDGHAVPCHAVLSIHMFCKNDKNEVKFAMYNFIVCTDVGGGLSLV